MSASNKNNYLYCEDYTIDVSNPWEELEDGIQKTILFFEPGDLNHLVFYVACRFSIRQDFVSAIAGIEADPFIDVCFLTSGIEGVKSRGSAHIMIGDMKHVGDVAEFPLSYDVVNNNCFFSCEPNAGFGSKFYTGNEIYRTIYNMDEAQIHIYSDDKRWSFDFCLGDIKPLKKYINRFFKNTDSFKIPKKAEATEQRAMTESSWDRNSSNAGYYDNGLADAYSRRNEEPIEPKENGNKLIILIVIVVIMIIQANSK